MEKHRFQNNPNCTLQNMAKEIFAAEYAILIRYYHHTAKTSVVCTSTNGPAGQHAVNRLSKLLKNWNQIILNLNNYYSDSMEGSRTFLTQNITVWRHHLLETQSMYTNLSNVASVIFFIIQDGDGVEAIVSSARDVIGCMLSTAPGVNHYENLIIWQLC
jgi:hypothetical protein